MKKTNEQSKYFSVIIPTLGRDACVRQTLEDLNAQTFNDFDIWIIDQNQNHLENLSKHSPKIELHHEKTLPLGSTGGRNYAIFKTSSQYCLFIDDDVRLERDFIQKHFNATEANPNAVIAGRVVQPKDNLSEEQMQAMGQRASYSHLLGLVWGNFIGTEPFEVDHFHECNFSAPTAALKECGGFNTAFTGNAYFEGVDLAIRLKAMGVKIEYHPEISLIHLQEPSGGNRVNQKATHTYWMMRNQALLNSNHMNKLGVPFFGAYGFGYVLSKAIKNKDPEIAIKGIRGLVDGMKFFLPNAKRKILNNK